MAKSLLAEAVAELPRKVSLKSRREVRENENAQCVGGMRNPHLAVRRNAGLACVGNIVRACFQRFSISHPTALEVGQRFGDTDYKSPDESLAEEFRYAHRAELGAKIESYAAEKWGKPSPLMGELIDSWLSRAGDCETKLGTWVREGAPLGMAYSTY